MQESFAKEFIRQVEVLFDKQFPEEAIDKIVEALKPMSQKSAIMVIKSYENDKERRFRPTPKEFILDCQTEENRGNQKTDKIIESIKGMPGKSEAGNLGCKMCMRLTDLIFSGKVTRRQIVDNMHKAESVQPGIGWKEAANRLAAYYGQHGMNADGNPEVHIAFDLS